MHKINAIFLKYGYPIFPIGVMPFIWFIGYFVLDVGLSYTDFPLPDWISDVWFWFLPLLIWLIIFVISGRYFAYMKPKRIGEEIYNFNKSYNSTGMIFVSFDPLNSG